MRGGIRAARYGITPAAIDNILDDAFGEREVTQYFTQTNAYYVILEVLPWLQEDLATLNQLYVPSSTGAPVPLSNLVHIDTDRVVPLGVNHANQFPAVTLSFNLAENTAIGDAVQAIEQAVASLHPPASLSGQFEGTAATFQSSLASELRRPLGYTMVGRLAMSQVLTLYTTPVVYLYLDRLQHWLAPRRVRRYPALAEKLGSPAD